jgi:hypothetical protein
VAQLAKTLNGLAIASVKALNGLAIASAKTINGLDNTSSGGTSPGLTSIVAWYDMANADDADGGTYNLSPQNSPSFTAGPPSYVTTTDGAPGAFLQQTTLDDNWGNAAGDWSMVMRFRANAGVANDDRAFSGNGARTRVEYNTTSMRGRIANIAVTSAVAGAEATWYTMALVWDNTAGLAKISVNGDTFVTASGITSFTNGTMFFGATLSVNSNPFDIDYVGFWSKALTQDNVTWLYNSGGTRTYAEL